MYYTYMLLHLAECCCPFIVAGESVEFIVQNRQVMAMTVLLCVSVRTYEGILNVLLTWE